MKNLERILLIPAAGVAIGIAIALSPSKSYAQGPPVPLPSELRGFVDRQEVDIDSLFAYNKKDNLLLDGTVLSLADTVTAAGDTIRDVPDFYRFVVPTDDASTPDIVEGAVAGDTLDFKVKLTDGGFYKLVPITGPVIHEPGQIRRVDMYVKLPEAVEELKSVPEKFKLYQNYPNPFNPSTTIGYELDRRANVRITVYNINGKVVKNLVDGTKTAGRYEAVWDGTDKSMNPVASGVYIYRSKIGNAVETRKMTLIR